MRYLESPTPLMNLQETFTQKSISKTHITGTSFIWDHLNASHNAFYKNVEFMLELKYRKNIASYNIIKNDMLPIEGNPFEQLSKFDKPDEVENLDNEDSIVEAIYAINKATISMENDNYYIDIESKPLSYNVTIAPYINRF